MDLKKPAYIEQRSEEWFRNKLGKVGCSRLGEVMAKGRGNEKSKTRHNYMISLIAEKLTGITQKSEYVSDSVQWGIDHEDEAREYYTLVTGNTVIQDHGKESDEILGLWCSPDGLIDKYLAIEIKCPETTTHLLTMTEGIINQDYIYQMSGYCIVYGVQYVDFVSYDPRLPEHLKMYVRRFNAIDLPIEEVKAGVRQFIDEMNELLEKLESSKTAYVVG